MDEQTSTETSWRDPGFDEHGNPITPVAALRALRAGLADDPRYGGAIILIDRVLSRKTNSPDKVTVLSTEELDAMAAFTPARIAGGYYSCLVCAAVVAVEDRVRHLRWHYPLP